jgi:AraC-like DNA-binding protein/mannose-6-phosphate isomerase-like protein (cupin superfamily)
MAKSYTDLMECGGEEGMKEELKERLQHGDLLFHMKVYETRTCRNDKMVLYCHWHEELELLVITKGKARVQVGGRHYDVLEGEYVIIPPGTLHAAYSLEAEVVEFFAIVLHAEFVASFMRDLVHTRYIAPLFDGSSRVPLYISRETEQRISTLPLLAGIKEAYDRKEAGYELLIKARTFEVLYKLYRLTAENSGASPVSGRAETQQMEAMRRVVQYIQARYQDKITLDELAAAAHMSKGYFCRVFQKHFTMTPLEYVISLRVSQAAQLIVLTDKKITDIAMSTGFGNVNYFTTAFKKMFHCTPAQFRRNSTVDGSGKSQYKCGFQHYMESLSLGEGNIMRTERN